MSCPELEGVSRRECHRARVASAQRTEGTPLEEEPPPPHIEPGEEGWCGSYWDTEYGEDVFDKYCKGQKTRRLSEPSPTRGLSNTSNHV